MKKTRKKEEQSKEWEKIIEHHSLQDHLHTHKSKQQISPGPHQKKKKKKEQYFKYKDPFLNFKQKSQICKVR